ncbi:MAG: VCBS repeat-containing protein [Fimbriimonadaceae bacterium]|nr:VCBS repeat-containing protein [Fimbriimonadaceae bacterium]
MLAFCCLAIGWVTPTAPVFAPAVPWALNFAAPPRIPLVGDVNADGLADLICVYPEGDCIIDVSLNVEGQKPSFGFQARTGWGKNCQAAVSGDFDGDGKADVLGLFDGSELVLAGDFGDRKFRSSEPFGFFAGGGGGGGGGVGGGGGGPVGPFARGGRRLHNPAQRSKGQSGSTSQGRMVRGPQRSSARGRWGVPAGLVAGARRDTPVRGS